MPTKDDYNAVAPYVQSIGDFSAVAIETKLAAIPAPPPPPVEKQPVKQDIVNLFNTVYTGYYSVNKAIESEGGVLNLANAHNMSISQCKTCLREFEAMRALYNNPPIVE